MGAFFCGFLNVIRPPLISITLLFLWVNASAETVCAPREFHESVTIRNIIDGDTVRLADNRLVRLIGINTPEIDYDGGETQPLARDARAALKQIFPYNSPAMLSYGDQRKDRHGRTLAHIYLPDGTNIQHKLLEQGMGFWVAIPPNLQYKRCYQQAEAKARKIGLGVWGHDFFRPTPASEWQKFNSGFQLISGKISSFKPSGNSIWLIFNSNVALQIRHADKKYFNVSELENLIGKNIVARGWLYRKKVQWRMNIKHPSAIQRVR